MTAFALLLGTGLVALAGCTTSTTDGGADGGVGACAISGKGNVTVTVTGLPEGVSADASMQDGGGTTLPVVSGQVLSTTGGSYKVTAKIVTGSDPIVRTAYAATIDKADFCLSNGGAQTVAITYAPIASSGKLWHINDTPAQLLGFASASLAASGTPAATVAAKGAMGKSIAFDREGNLWAPGGTTTDAAFARYAAGSIGASGDKAPDREIRFDAGCLPGISSIAFASDGALWATSPCGKKVLRFAPADLAASGNPTPGVSLGGIEGAEGLAFDKDGNLWLADPGAKTIVRYDVARLAASSTDAPSLVLKTRTEGNADLSANHIAFDKDGNLWVSTFAANTIYKLTPADLAGAGPKTVIPGVQIALAVDVLPEGLSFDESGALWLTLSQGKIGRLGAGQLGTSTTPGAPATPEVIVTSADIGSAVAPTFFPSAKGTPLYAALP